MSIRQAFEELSATAEKVALLPYEWAKELAQNLTGHAGEATDAIEALQSRVSQLESKIDQLENPGKAQAPAQPANQQTAQAAQGTAANPTPAAGAQSGNAAPASGTPSSAGQASS